MPGKAKSDSVAQILAALGNPTRFALVKRLSTAETFAGLSIVELTAASGLTRQAITKHLETLEEAGLVIRRKPGRATWYELKKEPIQSVIEALSAVANLRAESQRKLKAAERSFRAKL